MGKKKKNKVLEGIYELLQKTVWDVHSLQTSYDFEFITVMFKMPGYFITKIADT